MSTNKILKSLFKLSSTQLINLSCHVQYRCILKAKSNLARMRLVNIVRWAACEEMRKLHVPWYVPTECELLVQKVSFWNKIKRFFYWCQI